MTLEEHIDFAKNKSKHLFESAYEEKDTLIACVYGKEALISGEVADLLEELKTLRKAYNLACEGHGNYYCRDICGEEIDCSDKSCSECLKVYFMQKARENNDN